MKKLTLLLVLLSAMFNAPAQVKDPQLLADAIKNMNAEEKLQKIREYIAGNPVTPVIINDSTFALYWFGKASRAGVSGDLQSGWSKNDDMQKIKAGDSSFFFITYTVPKDSRFDYMLVHDNRYIVDPGNPVVTPSGFGPHSQVAMPGFKSDPLMIPSEDVSKGTVDSIFFKPKDTLLRARYLKIYHPAGNPEKPALLFVYDGFEALKFENYNVVLDNMIAKGMIHPVVAVFIPPAEREDESVGSKTVAFINMICDELVPLMINKYGVSADPVFHGITGISAGGHLAFATPVVRPDVVACGAGQSSTISRELVNALQDLPDAATDGLKIYIDVGRYDLPGNIIGKTFHQSNKDFAAEVGKKGIEYKFVEVNDGHSWASWRERTSTYLMFFWGKR